jgi:hypothetical protein
MTDSPAPLSTNFAPIAATAMVSSAAGSFSAQPLGQSIADIIIWTVSVHCTCVPPESICKAIGYLSITAVSVLITACALLLHYVLLKQKG